MSPFKRDLVEVLNHSKTDKVKLVREAAQEAIVAVKELEGDDENASETGIQNNSLKRISSPDRGTNK